MPTLPTIAWTRRMDAILAKPGTQANSFSPGMLIKMLPMILRMGRLMKSQADKGFDPINVFNAPRPGPNQGVPLGGLGCGSIGRGWRGEFRRWLLRPGFIQHRVVWADQFSLFVKRPGQPAQAQVLHPAKPEGGELSAWQWQMDPTCATYHALFPRAWTEYDHPLPGLKLVCRQVSPVIAHNYRESSYPVAVFEWTVENTAAEPAEVSLMFTFQNSDGTPDDSSGGFTHQPFELPSRHGGDKTIGVEMSSTHRQRVGGLGKDVVKFNEDPLTFVIAASQQEGVTVTRCPRFTCNADGAGLWADFSADGRLEESVQAAAPSTPGETIGAAVAASLSLEPGESRTLSFALAWDMPIARPGAGTLYYRRYTQFYGTEGKAAPVIARDALDLYPLWEEQIEAWQTPILSNDSLPEWYRCMLFNELYYLVDGGTLWAYTQEEAASVDEEHMGHFAYLESHEYRMYNTYDVHFYAGFALGMLWPKIELSLQRDMAGFTLSEDPELVEMAYDGKKVPRKVRAAVPHDVGIPQEDFWRKLNGYNMHDINEWKDLNPKFVLQVYRCYVQTGDLGFVKDCWEAVEAAMLRIAMTDLDGDGMIENSGFPDQTYDVWSVKGVSAYTGGLWLACLSAAAAMADLVGKPEKAKAYRKTFLLGQPVYQQKLWNGRYYNYDESSSKVHDSIMADQMAGQWYALACNLPPVVESQHARQALETVFAYNVERFAGGLMGAVNGMRPDGKVDQSSMQAREVWSGTTFAVAAAMLQAGLRDQAFKTAYGVYKVIYEDRGYWFQTPEAWDITGNFRALTYMRPLSIWAMQYELERLK